MGRVLRKTTYEWWTEDVGDINDEWETIEVDEYKDHEDVAKLLIERIQVADCEYEGETTIHVRGYGVTKVFACRSEPDRIYYATEQHPVSD